MNSAVSPHPTTPNPVILTLNEVKGKNPAGAAHPLPAAKIQPGASPRSAEAMQKEATTKHLKYTKGKAFGGKPVDQMRAPFSAEFCQPRACPTFLLSCVSCFSW
ncbi:MAG: hypothetical protein HZA93_10805 [Verrucomicrobia bacterium]|nr:hypothetical protein [Verrucomicrobiota bacterium]